VYAWLVYREQTKLKRQLTKAQAGFEQAERGRDGALANWIDTLRPLLLEDSRFSRLLSALASDEVSLDTARAEFDRTLAKVALTDQSLDEEQRELEGRVETANAELQERTRTCADAERTLAREQAKRKRIDIEARAAGGISPPTFDQRTAEADRALALASDQLQEFQQNVAASERAYAALCLEQRRLADRKKAEGIAGSRHEQLLQQGILVSQRNLLQAKANIGRSVLALRESRYLDDLTRCVLLQHDDEVSQATLRHRALLTQLGGFDRQAVRQGLWLSIGTLVLGLLLAMASIVC
jgi:multidrug resistance efflux pump